GGYVGGPEGEARRRARLDPRDLQRLVRILRADGHGLEIGLVSAPTDGEPAGAAMLLAAPIAEAILSFDPAVALSVAHQAPPHPAHQPSVQELMVHVHQVLVH